MLGCSFLLPFLQFETAPKGFLLDSSRFLPFGKEFFLIFLQFEPPPKGIFFTDSKVILLLPFLFIPLFPTINACFPPYNDSVSCPTWVHNVSIVLIYLLYLTKDLAKKEHHHGEAVCRVLWHGYVIFSHPLAVTCSRWTDWGCCRSILLNYVNCLWKKLIITLIYFISFFNPSKLDHPKIDLIKPPLRWKHVLY